MYAPHRRACAVALLLASCSDRASSSEPETVIDVRLDAGLDNAAAHDSGRAQHDASDIPRDAGRRPVPIPMQCEPGRYVGTFLCAIAGIVPWFGKMEFELVEDAKGSGEFTTLSIAAGTRITSDLDSMGGTFSGDLQADFDCRTGELQGELANGIYLLAAVMPWRFGGPLEGSYRVDDAGVPGFDGTLGTLTTPDLWFYGPLAPTGMCEWTASRVSEPLDAGP